MLTTISFAQLTTNNPDTICPNATGSIYQVPSSLPAGLNTNAVSVIATNTVTGCQSQPVNLNVFVLTLTPTITSIGPFCQGAPCVNLVGTPSGGLFSGTGVVSNQFCPTTSGVGSFTVTYTVTQNGCNFSTSTTVVVGQNPVLAPIQHN